MAPLSLHQGILLLAFAGSGILAGHTDAPAKLGTGFPDGSAPEPAWEASDTLDVTGRVEGVVLQAGSGRPVPSAWVALGETGIGGFTGADGRFSLRGPVGSHHFSAGSIGYATRGQDVEVQAERVVFLEVHLSTEAVALDPITVQVRSPALERVGYYQRLAGGLSGTRITREAIEQERPRAFSDLFHSVPGLRVYEANGQAQLRSRRVVGSTAGCEATLYIDGFPINERMNLRANQSQLTNVNIVDPGAIEAVEVYLGAATPPQFPSRCGVILVWTRH